ncbi:uncharacterized protein LTR77_004502 [Saxophila tyrrhenica]|uniref:DUF7730 domain-containing protein n=1 Tax=Saxophila tyrrhenica TaxID=1690608 RepID=A0AAV9PH49_9PEZI|nr:hypothetical protein LTR77_004502 [Saxophila tyrrhenica]
MATNSTTTEFIDISERIESVVAPWRTTTVEKPPFTAEQLTAMAILVNGGEVFEVQIHRWGLDTFAYYRQELARGLCALPTGGSDPRTTLGVRGVLDIHRGITSAVQSFDLPLLDNHDDWGPDFGNLSEDNWVEYLYELESNASQRCYRLATSAGEQMLSSVFRRPGAKDQSTFKFFGLSAELRERIYEMVFAYPSSGLEVCDRRSTEHAPKSARGGFLTLSRSWDDSFTWKKWNFIAIGAMNPPMNKILRPLLIGKRFYNEVMPVFYRINHFHFPDPHLLSWFAKNVAPTRLQRIAQISIDVRRDPRALDDAFFILSRLQNLRILDVKVDEEKSRSRGRPDLWDQVMRGKSVKKLDGMRGLKSVTVEGSPTLEREVEPLMLRTKAEQAALKPRTMNGKSWSSMRSWCEGRGRRLWPSKRGLGSE